MCIYLQFPRISDTYIITVVDELGRGVYFVKRYVKSRNEENVVILCDKALDQCCRLYCQDAAEGERAEERGVQPLYYLQYLLHIIYFLFHVLTTNKSL